MRIAPGCAALLCAALVATGCSDRDEPRVGGQPLSHWVDEAQQGSIMPWWNSRGDERRAEAFRQLVALGEPAVPALLELLDDRRRWISGDALNALAALGPRAASATPVLIHRLEGPDPVGEILLLERIGPRAAAAVPKLAELAQRGSPRVRESAASALSALGEPGREALERLGAAGGSESRRSAVAGRMLLARREQRSGELLVELLSDPDPRVRREALERMRPAQWGTAGSEEARAGLDLALRASHDADPSMRRASERWLLAAARRLDRPELVRLLLEAGSPAVRRQAVWLFTPRFAGWEGLDDATAAAVEQALADPDPSVRLYSVLALSRRPGAEGRIAVARSAVSELPPEERAQAARHVYEISGDPADLPDADPPAGAGEQPSA